MNELQKNLLISGTFLLFFCTPVAFILCTGPRRQLSTHHTTPLIEGVIVESQSDPSKTVRGSFVAYNPQSTTSV